MLENYHQPDTSSHDTGFTIERARYAGRWNGKPQYAIYCRSNNSGWKTRAMRLAGDHLKGRWSNREKAYIVSSAKAEKMIDLYVSGKDCSAITGDIE